MTERISLDGKVVVVTGTGRGLGRAYVELLAERGARVVVNDLGTDVSGFGKDSTIAEHVADLIRSRGGEAIADDSDVSTPEGGSALIAKTIEHFGRIDLLVNTISPVGYTRMHPAAGSRVSEADGKAAAPVEAVAPAIVWLASDGCSDTSRIYHVEAGAIQRIAIVMGPGFYDPHLTPERIAENYAKIESIQGFSEPGSFEPG